MSEVKAISDGAPPVVRISPEVPVLFADGVSSHAFVPGISKFYFYRIDSHPIDVALPSKTEPVAQVIMPAEGFAAMVHFLQHRLSMMIAQGAISQEAVDRINKSEYPPPPARAP